MSLPEPDPELERLLSGLCDETLADEDLHRLGRRISNDTEARRSYLQYLDLHAALSGPGPAAALPELPVQTLRASARFRRIAWRAAAAALLVLTGWGVLRIAVPAGTPVVARLADISEKVHVQDPSGRPLEVADGMILGPGSTVRTGGDLSAATIEFEDGIRLDLSPEAQLHFAGPGARVVLSAGLLRADVKPRPKEQPLVVTTPQAEIVVLGTRFVVSAVAPDATEVETESGSVRMTRLSDGRSIEVGAGSAAVASPRVEAFEARPIPPVTSSPRVRVRIAGARAVVFSGAGKDVVALGKARWGMYSTDAPRSAVTSFDLGPDVHTAYVSADGGTLLVSTRNGKLRVLEPATGKERCVLEAGPAFRWASALSGDGTRFAAGHSIPGPLHEIRVWDATTGIERPRVSTPGTVRGVALSADGRRLAASFNATRERPSTLVVVWNLAQGARLASFSVSERSVPVLAFSPDGRRVAGAADTGMVHLWEVDSGKWLAGRGLEDGWTRSVGVVAFSPGGRYLAAGTADGRVRLWDTRTDHDVSILDSDRQPVAGLAFSPDGRTLAMTSASGILTLWDAPPE
jgi:ferric-dicitrate binding protein FerR (iron transport regulator)